LRREVGVAINPQELLRSIFAGPKDSLGREALREFLKHPKPGSQWLDLGPYQTYLRRSVPRPDYGMQRPLDLANIQHADGGGGGRFRELMSMLEAEAQAGGYDGIYVENILNEFLPEVLARYGYSVQNGRGYDLPVATKKFGR